MSVYTLGEIAGWLAAAGVLGFILGWLVHEIVHRERRAARPGADLAAQMAHDVPVQQLDETLEQAVVPGAFTGSALPGPGGSSPSPAHVVKGKVTSMIYHAPGTALYDRTVAQVWFTTRESAEAAGFRKPRNT